MRSTELIATLAAFTLCGCAASDKAELEAFNNGGWENNWDKIEVVAVDGRRIRPRTDIKVRPGEREIIFSINYMRGDLKTPILVEVPVKATFAPGRRYRAHPHYQTAMLGVWISEVKDSTEGYTIAGGASIYSPEFDAYGSKNK